MSTSPPSAPLKRPPLQVLPYLQLLRLPNVFTAMADILMGFFFTHELFTDEHATTESAASTPWGLLLLLLTTSSLLYLAGIVLNDFFDYQQDARERPHRPIPSGRVLRTQAAVLGFALFFGGVAVGWITNLASGDWRPGVVSSLLAIAVLAYDAGLKRTPLGPIAMGACRLLNVRLGMSLADDPGAAVNWIVAIGIGLYITGVTWFARREAAHSGRLQLAGGLFVMLAGLVLINRLGMWQTGKEVPPLSIPERWDIFWLLVCGMILYRGILAIQHPTPSRVQAIVKLCIFMLIVIDAGICLAVHGGLWAALILLLLLPTMFLGRWIYST